MVPDLANEPQIGARSQRCLVPGHLRSIEKNENPAKKRAQNSETLASQLKFKECFANA